MADVTGRPPLSEISTWTQFYELIQRLCDEHERELSSLRSSTQESCALNDTCSQLDKLTTCHSHVSFQKTGLDDRSGAGRSESRPIEVAQEVETVGVGETVQPSSSAADAQSGNGSNSGCQTYSWDTRHLTCSEYKVHMVWVRRTTTRQDSLLSEQSMHKHLRSMSFASALSLIGRCQFRKRLICSPTDPVRLGWDAIAFVTLMCDFILAPMQAFQLPRSGAILLFDWFSRLYWTLDIPASILVGFYERGVLVRSPNRIVRRYLTTFFLLDLIIVGTDWLLLVLGSGSSDESSGEKSGIVRLSRVLRIARMLRLLRFFKLVRLIGMVDDIIDTEVLSIYFSAIKPIFAMLLWSHLLACAWYGVGTADSVSDQAWVVRYDVHELSLLYRYVTSYQWSFAQISMGSMDILPHSLFERTFAILVMMLGIFMFSSMISSWTAAVAQIHKLRSDESTQVWVLRRFLNDHRISKPLQQRIQRYAEFVYHQQRERMSRDGVSLLGVLSEQLYNKLECEIYAPYLSVHPHFHHMMKRAFMARVCGKAVSTIEMARTEVVFYTGEPGYNFFVCMYGELIYMAQNCDSRPDNHSVSHTEIHKGDWVAEATLWMQWTHVGELRASSECKLVSVKAAEFGQQLQLSDPKSWSDVQKYALAFVELVNELQHNHMTDLLHLAFTPYDVMSREPELPPQDSSVAEMRPTAHSLTL